MHRDGILSPIVLAVVVFSSSNAIGVAQTEQPTRPGTDVRATAALADGDIRTMLADYIDRDRLGVGIAVGIVDEQGARVICHGTLDNGTDREVNGDTLFAIASVTKVFTALLLQDMIERGEMKADDPVQKYLPASVRMPMFHGKPITLLHLATHTSGLPRDCDGDVYAFLSHCTLHQAPGTREEYSNFGMGLLGHVIALKAGKDYESLVIDRICRPLGMDSTRVAVGPESRARLAAGHAMPGHRVRDFTPVNRQTNAQAPVLLGAGSIRSTANDLLKFVAAYAGRTPSPLSELMRKAQALHPLESGAKRRLAWAGDGPVFEHGGLTEGYQAELAFDVNRRRGVVVLSNCANYGTLIPGLWQPLLEGRSPRPARIEPPDPTNYDHYAGVYRYAKGGDLCSVRRVGDRLLVQALGIPGHRVHFPSYEVFPQSESIFRNEFWDVQIELLDAKNGTPPRLTLTSLGPRSGFQGSVALDRISTDVPPPPVPVHIDPAIYDGYAGRYRKTFLWGLIRVGPTLVVSVAKDDFASHLIARVRGLGAEEIFPETETSFLPGFNVAEDLRLTFVRNKAGRTKGVVVDWNGKRYRGTRISETPGS